MADLPLNEGLLTANRISELREQPVNGQFGSAHLREVHRRIFQDLIHHGPGEFRSNAPGHFKRRELESGERYVVGYGRGRDIASRLDSVLGALRGGAALTAGDPDVFAGQLARVYGDLDFIHPFQEGNSRTLREFTTELAEYLGYDLDWQTTAADGPARDRLYRARDREVLTRQYPGLDEARAMSTVDRTEYESFYVLQRLSQGDHLETIIRKSLTLA